MQLSCICGNCPYAMVSRARFRFAFALAVTLLALAMQWCVPLAHAAHQRAVEAGDVEAAHASQPHDHGEHSEHRHDESQCPTCQHFVALRAFTPAVAPVTLAAAGAVATGAAPQYVSPFASRFAHAPAVPRGPPVS